MHLSLSCCRVVTAMKRFAKPHLLESTSKRVCLQLRVEGVVRTGEYTKEGVSAVFTKVVGISNCGARQEMTFFGAAAAEVEDISCKDGETYEFVGGRADIEDPKYSSSSW